MPLCYIVPASKLDKLEQLVLQIQIVTLNDLLNVQNFIVLVIIVLV